MVFIADFWTFGKERFYVDVGALHPSYASNTKMLNLMGWSGINIDANEENIRLFELERPADTNVLAVISDTEEEIEFYIYDAAGVSTADPEMVERHSRSDVFKIRKTVRLKPERLASVLERSLCTDQAIDLMSVDVEGFDLKALRSNDWERFAPFFLMVEDHDLIAARSSPKITNL